MIGELLTERLRAEEVAALCAEYGVGSLYELPAARFDALCHGEAERVIEELEAERGEPLPGHGEEVEEPPPGYAWLSQDRHICGVSRTALVKWRRNGRLGWVRLPDNGTSRRGRVYYCVADVERLKLISTRRYLMR